MLPPGTPPSIRAIEAFAMHLGLALHRYGTPAHRLEEALSQIAQRFGVPAHFLSTPTSITASFGLGADQRVYLARADQGEMNLEKLSLLDELSTEVILGECDPSAAYVLIDTIMGAPKRFGPLWTTVAFAGASGAIARLFSGGWLEMLVAAVIGLAIGASAVVAEHVQPLGRVFDLGAAVLSALLAAAAYHLVGSFSLHTATLAGLIVLVPGMTLTTAMTELSTGNLVSGTARLMGAGMTFMKLGFGVALGTRLGDVLFNPGVELSSTAPTWTQLPALGVAAVSLSIILQAHPRELGWILGTCYLGMFGAQAGAKLLGPELGAFMAALAVTLGSNLYARALHRASSVTQVPAILLLVPGSVGYRAVSALLERNVLSGMETAFSMVLTAMALVAGTLLAGLLLPPRKVL
jgi:uncharacterized membrane protein YjjP (DUF1212 family)